MNANAYDALIVGGGPAGLASAIVLGKSGFRVLLADRRSLPADKACGEGVLPPGLAILERLGVRKHIASEHSHTIRGIRYVIGDGDIAAEAEFVEGPGLGVRRTALSAALLAEASLTPGVEIIRARPEISFPFSGRVLIPELQKEITAKLIVGADGLQSSVRKAAGLEKKGRKRTRYGIRAHFQSNTTLDDFVTVHVNPGMEAYVTPVGEREAGAAVLFSPPADKSSRDRTFDEIIRNFPHLEQLSFAQSAAGAGPLEQHTRSVIADGLALVGDAAGYLDAATGEGISLALAEACALEEIFPAIRECPSGRIVKSSSLRPYASTYRKIIWNYQVVTQSLLFLSEHPRLARFFVGMMHRHPASFQALLSFNQGAGLNSVLGRFLRGLWKSSADPVEIERG